MTNRSRNLFLQLTAFIALVSCGKVSNLSDEAGLNSGAYVSVTLDPRALLPATVNVPYKEVPKINGGLLPFHFTLVSGALPTGLTLDPNSGVISGTVPDSEAGRQQDFALQIMDANQITDTKNYSIKVNPYTYTVLPEELPTVIPRQTYKVRLSTVGGIQPITYEIVGSLPTGMKYDAPSSTLSANDDIGLLDTSKDKPKITVKAKDANGVEVAKEFSLTVASANYVAITLTEKAFNNVPVDVPYKDVILFQGGLAPLSFKVTEGALPDGLALDEATGLISGTVTAASVQSPQGTFKVLVKDSLSVTNERTYSYSLKPYAITVTPTDLPSVIPTLPYTTKFAAIGAAEPVTYKASGALPPKLRLKTDGTLEAFDSFVSPADQSTNWPIEVTATDANGVESTANLTIKVGAAPVNSAPLVIQTTTLASMIAGTSYSSGISTTGGVAPLTYTVTSGSFPSGLSLASSTGLITGNLAFSASGAAYAVVVQVTDSNGATANKTYSGTVQTGSSALSIKSTLVSTPVAGGDYSSVIAITGGLAPYVFSVTAGTLPSGLTLNSSTGAISGTVAVNAAGQPFFFTVSVTDAASQTDAKSYSGTIGSVSAPLTIQNTTLVTPLAGSGYSSGMTVSGGVHPLTFAIISGALPTGLTLNASTGVVSGSLGYAQAGQSFAVTIRVTDNSGQTASKGYTGTVASGASALAISSSSLAAMTAGQAYGAAVAVTGGVTPYTFALSSGTLPSGLSLNTSTGVISGNVPYTSSGASYTIDVTVTDAASQTATKTFSGTVGNVTAPLTIQSTSLPTPLAGASYSAGVTVAGGVHPLTFSITSGALPTGLSLDTSTGVVSGSLSYGMAGTSFVVTIRVVDTSGQQASKAFTGTVATGASALTIASTSLPTMTAGQGYGGVVAVTGGVTPYAFSVSAGALPSGVSLAASTGVISGTPAYAAAGASYSVDITVTDAAGQTATKTYAGTVAAVPSPLTIQNTTLPTPLAGSGYSAGLTVSGGVHPLAFSVTSGALPTGLSLNTSTGVVSGSLAFGMVGTAYSFQITASDTSGQSAAKTYTGTVGSSASALSIVSATMPTPTAGTTYAATVGVTGGVTAYSFAVTSGALPTGMSLNSTTGVISGTPTYATAATPYTYEITVTDAATQTAARTYSGTVGSPATLSIATATVAAPTAGAGYLAVIAASGGVPPYTFSVSSGTLPAGLSLSSAGLLSGTATYASRNVSYVFTVLVTDSVSHTASQSYSGITNDYSMSVMPTSLVPPVPGAYYAGSVGAVSGEAPYTYSISAGSLPSGLSLNSSTGAITGTVADAEAGQNKNVTIRATDANGATSTRAYTVSTVSFAVSITTSSLANASEGAAYTNSSTALAATGGTGPYAYLYTGTLPTGVGLTSAGTFFGTPASGQGSLSGVAYPIQVRARDATGALTAATSLTLTVGVSVPTMTAGNLTSAVKGMPYSQTVSASGGRPPYVYSLTGSLPTGLSLSTGGAITGTPTASAACPASEFTIIATDSLAQSSSASVKQCIPTSNGIVLTNSSLADPYEGVAYSNASTALTASGGTGPYTFTYTGTLPDGIGLTSTGTFFGTAAAGQGSISGTAYPIAIQVKDSTNAVSLPVTLTLSVRVNTPTVVAGSMAGAILGTPYSQTLTASGGRPPYVFAVAVGSLPTGLSLSAAGVVSGTPTGTATCPANQFSITATDSLAQTSTSVNKCIATSNGINITNASFPTIVIGTNYNFTVTVAGGTAPYTFSATSLPSGIVINSSTGVLSGFTNAASGNYTGYIYVSDSSATQLTTTRSVDFKVRDPLALASATLPRAAAAPGAGVAYSHTFAATGGVTPITYAVTAGSLPSGLSLASGGALTGSSSYDAAVAGSYNFTVTATDAANATVSQAYTIYVSTRPTITNRNLGIAVVGTPFAVDMQRVGGANPFIGAGNIASQLSWSASGLPTGLSIGSTNGRISGTPSGAPGNYNVNVTVADAYGFSHTKTLVLKLNTAGKTLDLKTARFSEPCLANTTACDPRAHAISKLTGNSQYFVTYGRNDLTPKAIQIAKVDSAGRIPTAGGTTSSISVTLPANVGTLTSMQVADLDQDGKLDIVFVDANTKQVCALWNAGTVDTIGMPTGFSSSSMKCWVVPAGGDAANAAYALTVASNLRPDATNNGKQDLIVTSSLQGGVGNSVVVMLNSCAAGGACTGTRATLFNNYIAPTGNTTSGSAVITSVPSTTGVQVGMPVVGLGIPAGATVASFVANTSITLSANATLTNTGVALSLPTAYATTGNTTSGSATITSVASTTGVQVGMSVSGPNIPLGVQVVSFVANTSITISQAATGTAAGSAILTFGPMMITPQIIAAANSKMSHVYDVSYGYFNATAPNPPTTYATGASTCPALTIAGFQQTATGNGYLYVARQNYSGGVCTGDFSLHAANDEQFVTNGTPYLGSVTATDFNNDGISDIAVGIGNSNQTNSASIRVYLMPGGATFTGATTIAPQLQSLNGMTVGAAKIQPFCLDGSSSCSYPSILATCDRAYYWGRATSYACLSILPNQCSTSGCTTAFESSTPTARIDYPGVYGQNREPILAPVVSTANLTPTGNTTSGSATVASMSSTSGIQVGQPITGAGIAANTYVTAVNSGASTITLSQNASATASTVTLTIPAVPTLNDVIMMGVDSTNAEPYFLVYARNGSSTTDPLKGGMHLNAFPSSYLEAGEMGTMRMADLNNDGVLDLAGYLNNQGALSTWVSNSAGSPTYSLASTLAPNYLATPSYSGCPSGSTSCLPDPIFSTMGAVHGYPVTWNQSQTMDTMDINNDGYPDHVVVGYSSRGVSVALGNSVGGMGASILYDVGSSGGDVKPYAASFGDLDQDGFPDIAVASINVSGSQSAYVSWVKGNGDGTFQTAQVITGVTSTCTDIRAISPVDLDGDGRPELSILCYQTQPQGVWIARRHTNGTWVAQTGPTINASGGSNGVALKWGRLTSTTGMDLVVTGLDTTNTMRIISGVTATVTNAATGAFTLSGTPGTYMSGYGYGSDVDIADFNGDGYGDVLLVTGTQNGSTAQNGEVFYTCQSTGAGACTLKGWGMEGYQIVSGITGDVDGDFLPEIFTGYKANSPGIQRLIYRTVARTMNTSY